MKSKIPNPPRGIRKIPWRLPIWLYRIHLGWIFGHRALLLMHKGRLSGKIRFAVLEVIKYDKENNIHYVASGFGEKSDWYKNLVKEPKVTIETGGKNFPVQARIKEEEEAQEIFSEYMERYPNAIKNLAKLVGYDIGESDQDTLDFLRMIPVVAFIPNGE